MVRSRRILESLLVSVAVTLLASTAGSGQPRRSATAVGYLSTLRVGQWVQLEGASTGPSTVACTQVGQLAGDFLDDDWSLRGVVRAIDPAKREFSISACRVSVDARTTYENPRGTLRAFAGLRNGMVVEVDGSFLQSGRLLAAEVDDETDEIAREPELRNEIQVLGKIERVDVRRRMITIMGIQFSITEKTRLRSAIQ